MIWRGWLTDSVYLLTASAKITCRSTLQGNIDSFRKKNWLPYSVFKFKALIFNFLASYSFYIRKKITSLMDLGWSLHPVMCKVCLIALQSNLIPQNISVFFEFVKNQNPYYFIFKTFDNLFPMNWMLSLNKILCLSEGLWFFTYKGQFTLKVGSFWKLPTSVRFGPRVDGSILKRLFSFLSEIFTSGKQCHLCSYVNLLTIMYVDSLPLNLRQIL